MRIPFPDITLKRPSLQMTFGAAFVSKTIYANVVLDVRANGIVARNAKPRIGSKDIRRNVRRSGVITRRYRRPNSLENLFNNNFKATFAQQG